MIAVCAILLCVGELSSYHIGNSLTFNSRPDKLPHTVGYHLQWNQDLGYIRAHPDTPDAFRNPFGGYLNSLQSNSWDFVTIQPFVGADLNTDLEFFEHIRSIQPDATLVLYAAWPSIASSSYEDAWLAPLPDVDSPPTNQTAAYFDLLSSKLLERGIEHIIAPAGEVLYEIDLDAREGLVPNIETASDLYADDIHVSRDYGWYTAHSVVHHSLYGELPESYFFTPFYDLAPETLAAIDENILSVMTKPVVVINPPTSCDLNQDLVCDANDIDRLTVGILSGEYDRSIDVDDNGVLDERDRVKLITNWMNTYFGDSNLDGEFNTTDFIIIFQAGKYEDEIPNNASWADGDWDGDGDFTSSDFILALREGYEAGLRSASAVPEPDSLAILVLGLPFILIVRDRVAGT